MASSVAAWLVLASPVASNAATASPTRAMTRGRRRRGARATPLPPARLGQVSRTPALRSLLMEGSIA